MSKLRELGSTRFWSRVGAVLGLLATLWATLIGKTLPDLLASSDTPVQRFYHAANAACLPLAKVVPVPPPASPLLASNGAVRPISPGAVIAIATLFIDRAADPAQSVPPQLFAIAAPPEYASLYGPFEQEWETTVPRLETLGVLTLGTYGAPFPKIRSLPAAYVRRGGPARARAQFYGRQNTQLVHTVTQISSTLAHLSEQAHLMKLSFCERGLASIISDVEALREALLRAPGAAVLTVIVRP